MCGNLECLERRVFNAARSRTFPPAFSITSLRHSAGPRVFPSWFSC